MIISRDWENKQSFQKNDVALVPITNLNNTEQASDTPTPSTDFQVEATQPDTEESEYKRKVDGSHWECITSLFFCCFCLRWFIFYSASLQAQELTLKFKIEGPLRDNTCHFCAPSGLITQLRQIWSCPHPPMWPTQRGGSPGGKEETPSGWWCDWRQQSQDRGCSSSRALSASGVFCPR